MTNKMTIMAAVDLSDYSPMVIRYSVWLSMKTAAELVLVNVINQRDLDMVQRAMAGYEAFSFPNYLTDQTRERERQMKEMFEKASNGTVACSYMVQAGIPYREVLAAVEAVQPKILVVGTKGRSNLADAVVGSTARKLYRRSPIPLLTIPAGFNELP
ncbi:MAG TPA: universal stress protein [Desulfosarcina sp.]|nr:universal stress protein [Desulfosarcina sp.]